MTSEPGPDSPPAGEYDTAVAVERCGGDRWRGEVVAGWEVGTVTNGGYVMGIAVEAALDALELPDPLTLTCHFLTPSELGPIEITVERVRRGRRHGTAVVRLQQNDRDVLRLLATCTDLGRASGPTRVMISPPELPDRSTCPTLEEIGGFISRPISEKISMRFHPAHVGFLTGNPNGHAKIAGWARFSDGREPDVRALPVFSDCFPPSTVNLDLDIDRAPTLELTVQVRARPASGWLRGTFRTEAVAGSYVVEDGELWDERGVLVAQSRQLALVPGS